MNASVLPPKKPPLRSCNNYWVSAWCPENGLMVELLPSALLSRGLGVQSRGGTLALSEVQERRPSRDHEKPVMTSQTQAAEEPGLPDPPDALGKQGQERAAPLPPPDSSRAGTLQAHDLELSESPQHGATLSIQTDALSPRCCCRDARGPRPDYRCVFSDTWTPTMCRSRHWAQGRR